MIAGFGGAILDHIYKVSHWPGVNETSYIRDSWSVSGGMVLNALYAVRKLGEECAYHGALGDDEDGRMILSMMEERGIDGSGCYFLSGEDTPVSQIMIDPEGNRTIFHRRGLRDIDLHDPLSFPSLEGADFLLLDGSWIENALIWAEEANRLKIPILLDLSANNLHPLRDDLIRRADYPVLPVMLGEKICGLKDPMAQVESLQKRYGGVIAVSAGPRGVFWNTGEGGSRHLPAFTVDVVDTTGAGDTFHGALAFALNEGQALEEALRYAMAVAALKCTGHGQAHLPDREQVRAFLEERS